MKVREALVADPLVLPPDAPAREVAAVLARPQVESVLVVADGGRLAGAVRTDDIVAALAAGRDVAALTAAELADPDVAAVDPDLPLEEALHLMAERGLERLAVVDAEGGFHGILPRAPLVRRLAEDEPPPEPAEEG